MKNAKRTAFTAYELAARRQGGEDRSEWERVRAMSGAEVEAASHPDEAGMQVDWSRARVAMPERRRTMTMRLDADVLDYFQRMGRGYQTRINAVLRSYMEHAKD